MENRILFMMLFSFSLSDVKTDGFSLNCFLDSTVENMHHEDKNSLMQGS